MATKKRTAKKSGKPTSCSRKNTTTIRFKTSEGPVSFPARKGGAACGPIAPTKKQKAQRAKVAKAAKACRKQVGAWKGPPKGKKRVGSPSIARMGNCISQKLAA